MNKYSPLETHLESKGNLYIPMTFSEIEAIIGDSLPLSARKHRAWWSNNPSNSVITYAWLSAGYKTSQVDMGGEKLVFQRGEGHVTPSKRPPEVPESHPLIGALRGQMKIAVGFDLTDPTNIEWEADVI